MTINTGLPDPHKHAQAALQATGGNGCRNLDDYLKGEQMLLARTIETL